MSKKIILCTLVAVSAAAIALPAAAIAAEEDVPVHLVGVGLNQARLIDGVGNAELTGSFGTIKATSWAGSASFESTTTGTLELTLKGVTAGGTACTTEGQPSGTITTTELPFHLVTVEDSVTHATGPGILITPNPVTKVGAHFVCGFLKFTIEGSLIGTITSPECGKSSSNVTLSLSSSSTGVQTHKTVVGTTTEYSWTQGGSPVSLDAEGTITLGTEAKLECT